MLAPARFVLSQKKLLEQYKKVAALADEVAYSAKTNYEVADVLEDLVPDCFFSIHSGESISKIKDKRRILFLAQGWNLQELDVIFCEGVRNFVIDNEVDLNTFLDYIKEKDVKVNLFLRIRLQERTIHTGKYFVYGMYSEQINKFIPEFRKNGKIGKLGVHFHRKSQNVSEWSLKYELEEVLSEETLKCVDYVNIGGGLPVRYKNFRADVLDSIFKEIKTLKKWLNSLDIKLMIEPGRFIAAPCVTLNARVKVVYNNDVIINCSVYNTAIDTFAAHNKLEIEDELEDGEGYLVKGMTPCSMDIFRYKVYLKDVKVGDEIVFLNAGAYNFYSDFCNLKKLETVVVD